MDFIRSRARKVVPQGAAVPVGERISPHAGRLFAQRGLTIPATLLGAMQELLQIEGGDNNGIDKLAVRMGRNDPAARRRQVFLERQLQGYLGRGSAAVPAEARSGQVL